MAEHRSMQRLHIWCNQILPPSAREALERGLAGHQISYAEKSSRVNLDTSPPDQVLRESDVAFGQPDPRDIIASPRLKWIHLSTAGYTKYDREDVHTALRVRGGVLTNSSSVYAEPCAQHVLAMMLALARQLPQALIDQRDQRWGSHQHSLDLRARCRLLAGDEVLLVGFGAIGRRIVELLAPFGMRITAARRRPDGREAVPTLAMESIDSVLPGIDHVINTLPAGENTDRFFNAGRFARMKHGAIFYNVGRGTTVDQEALAAALNSGNLSAAYLDVTDPEPLPAGHFLWTARNCYITPHSAGGHDDEYERLVAHFLDNLANYSSGQALRDRVA